MTSAAVGDTAYMASLILPEMPCAGRYRYNRRHLRITEAIDCLLHVDRSCVTV